MNVKTINSFKKKLHTEESLSILAMKYTDVIGLDA